MNSPLRVLELFCGIGGCAAALQPASNLGLVETVAAVDLSPQALSTYGLNFSHPRHTNNLEFLPSSRFIDWKADLWWMSPPCQPFTRRGQQRDDDDPRSRPLLALMESVSEHQPRYLALENVPGFASSRTRQKLIRVLDKLGYQLREWQICPSQLGFPNLRRRYYLLAFRERSNGDVPEKLEDLREPSRNPLPLSLFLTPSPDPRLQLAPPLLDRYSRALHIVDPQSSSALTSCFTSAYGRSPVRSGSYLQQPQGVRRFSPREILNLLGFPPEFRLPPQLTNQQCWRLVGNSLAVHVVRLVLSAIPELAASLGQATAESRATLSNGSPRPDGSPP